MTSITARELAGSGSDYVRTYAHYASLKTLKKALDIALNGDRLNYSKTLIKMLEREIRKRDKEIVDTTTQAKPRIR